MTNFSRFMLLGLLLWASMGVVPARAQSGDQMHFNIERYDGIPGILPPSLYIYASGVIDSSAAARLHALVLAGTIPAATPVFFDSPGGNLLGGMELGREIRADGFYTYVNAANGRDANGIPVGKPSVCASACTLAFLGGRFRFIDKGSIYAVHRFYFTKSPSNEVDIAQIISAQIVQYMRDMGVDPQLFTLMTEGDQTQVFVPTRDQLLVLNVINNGADKPVWSIESIAQGLYLKGEEDTVWGDNKLLFLCGAHGSMLLTAIFPARGREDFIKGERAFGITLDGNTIPVHQTGRVLQGFNHGNAIALVTLDRSLVQKILVSHTVGFSMQFSYDAPTFDGIADFDFSDGRQKMVGFLASCH